MNEDYRDFLNALLAENARFLIVGAHALAVHGYPRSTVDIDVWIEVSDDNAQRVWQALAEFGAPLEDLSIRLDDLLRPDVVIQLGLPPNRIDILTGSRGWISSLPGPSERRGFSRVFAFLSSACMT